MAAGYNLSGHVVTLQGWSYVFVGAASLLLTALLVVFPTLLGNNTLPVRWIVGGVLSFGVLLMLCGVVPYLGLFW
jgi:hypothetical protein